MQPQRPRIPDVLLSASILLLRQGFSGRMLSAVKYFFDTEFYEDGKTIDLISIGIVAEDGREFYAVSNRRRH